MKINNNLKSLTMKKLILILTLSSLLLSCSNGGNSGNSNTPTTGNNVDYEFTITINGQVNKVKGNTANGIPMGQSGAYNFINNKCYWNASLPYIYLVINDVSASNYISGQNLFCQISIPNAMLGTCQGQVGILGGAFDSVATSLGAYSGGLWSVTNGGSSSFPGNHYLPINITDLGTFPTTSGAGIYDFGNTFKGNYSGTIYLQSTTSHNYTIPVQLSIDFKAVRMG